MLSIRASIPLAALASLVACQDGGVTPQPAPSAAPPAPTPTTTASAAPTASALGEGLPRPKRPKTREAPSPEKMREYRKHLTEGRLLAGKSQWPEAIKAFEKALGVVPGDAPALTELGWAAFKAGELERAKKSSEEAINRTTSPKLQAMAHYNLGRIAEERKETKTALDHYRKSVALRPNETVEKRLAELSKKEKAPAPPAVEPLPCQTAAVKIADVCACLTKPEPGEPESPRSCEPVKEPKLPRTELTLLEAQTAVFQTDWILVAKGEKGFLPVGKIGSTHNPGAFGIYEELTIPTVTEKTAGKTTVLWFEARRDRHDSDMGIDEYEEETVRTVTLCVPPQGKTTEWRCPLTVPVERTYIRDRMQLEGFTPDAETRKLMTKGLPIKEGWALDVKLGDGKAEVSVTGGKPPPNVAALVGSHPL
ncbi:tetratricopeptide repeat protein [Polyangium jinanense]|uniref:Tetratricopeptide repeat protein n=1 Tax=Polyangium jinanense TaxID=2829994 RepID=A0A9X4B0J8_9BACT|nr:tetratricopeptide repeat protein [Polyangium jinanense]MDC3962956.1 tetratricopeptide repeat protein [Polyangium jinanense]MDC3989555.1 tetratricopeptide repeat protein [Polyangium jinanense]